MATEINHSWRMITIEKERMVRTLLSEGETVEGIYRQSKVSRVTIRKIRDSKGIYSGAPFRNRIHEPSLERNRITHRKEIGVRHNLKEAKRCPDCGGKVLLWPCLLCNPNVGCY